MVFDGVATLTADEARKTAQINFGDGRKAYVRHDLKVMHVTEANGVACSLHSRQGAPYHAALCDDEEAARQFQDITGQHPTELLGKPVYDHDGELPRIESVHAVDRYV